MAKSLIFLVWKNRLCLTLVRWYVAEGVCELGEEQSPIDIDSKDAYLVPGAQPFVFVNYNLSALSILLDEHTGERNFFTNCLKWNFKINYWHTNTVSLAPPSQNIDGDNKFNWVTLKLANYNFLLRL